MIIYHRDGSQIALHFTNQIISSCLDKALFSWTHSLIGRILVFSFVVS